MLEHYDVPNYRTAFQLPKGHEYCVGVFVINEGDKFHHQLQRMKDCQLFADVIVSDGGSSDGSTNPEDLKTLGVNTLLVKTDDGRLGSQMRILFSWALENGYKGVVVIDGNNKDSVESINNFVEKLKNGYDHVQGSRFITGGNAINTPVTRLLGLKLLHAPMIRMASKFGYTDTTNGFRAYSDKLLLSNKLAIFRNVFTGYELHYYLAINAPRNQFRCLEIPVTRCYPKGKVPTKISFIKGNLGVIMTLFKVCFGKYDAK